MDEAKIKDAISLGKQRAQDRFTRWRAEFKASDAKQALRMLKQSLPPEAWSAWVSMQPVEAQNNIRAITGGE